MKMGALGPVVGHHQLFDRVGLDLRDEEIHQGACACACRPTSSIELAVLRCLHQTHVGWSSSNVAVCRAWGWIAWSNW
jgi:hypothetical protein